MGRMPWYVICVRGLGRTTCYVLLIWTEHPSVGYNIGRMSLYICVTNAVTHIRVFCPYLNHTLRCSGQTHQNTPEHTRTHQNTPEHTRTHQNTPEHTRTHQKTPEHTRTHQNTPEHTPRCSAQILNTQYGILPIHVIHTKVFVLPRLVTHTVAPYPDLSQTPRWTP
jgi:hypothetical protein